MLLLALAASSAAHAETLTVADIEALSAASLGDDAIVSKIRSSGTVFALSTSEMLALKAKGVSGPVIAAMLDTAAPRTQGLSIDAIDPMRPHAPGVYVAGSDRMQRIDPTISNQAKTGGIFGYALTGGLASMSVKAAIQNQSARIKTSGTPTFFFFFDESNGVSQGSAWQAGTAAMVTSPSEFTLVRLTPKDGRREARVGSFNMGGSKTGVMDKDRLAFGYDLVRPGVYRVNPSRALPKGEYGFIFSLTGGGSAGALTARIYDFAVEGSAH